MSTNEETMRVIVRGLGPVKASVETAHCSLISELALRDAGEFREKTKEVPEKIDINAILGLVEMMAEDDPELAMETLRGILRIVGAEAAAEDAYIITECCPYQLDQYLDVFVSFMKDADEAKPSHSDIDPAWFM